LGQAKAQLLAARHPHGCWTGELSSSALSTATAVTALAIVDEHSPLVTRHSPLLAQRGLDWLAAHANADGGWGDTPKSLSNISTTALAWAAFGAVPGADQKHPATVRAVECWLDRRTGGLTTDRLAVAIIHRYGKDRTFSAPILTMCALAGRLGPDAKAWRRVLPLPFELAAFPHQFFAALRLPVVSYALPALVAIGQARHHHLPSRNPLLRGLRNLARPRTLQVLAEIQPDSGGFLEATPLTSFVVMSLAGSGQADHPVVSKGIEFLTASVRSDGSWPIDTNLATWSTTLSVNALAADGELPLTTDERKIIRDWLLAQQHRFEHPYTRTSPGGWAWTDLSGGVPDADDTAGALLALKNLGESDDRIRQAVAQAVHWLLRLQNADGGIPTFCRGWTNLPFDRSSPDLTAHALRSWILWQADLPAPLQSRVRRATRRALAYLVREQRAEGTWAPLWFGNQYAPDEVNLTYGTARVLTALNELVACSVSVPPGLRRKATEWLLSAQHGFGAWSGAPGQPPSIEETALALDALAGFLASSAPWLDPDRARVHGAVERGARWLVERVENGDWTEPSPIGFYFAKLWYYEQLYPLIFTVSGLGRVAKALRLV